MPPAVNGQQARVGQQVVRSDRARVPGRGVEQVADDEHRLAGLAVEGSGVAVGGRGRPIGAGAREPGPDPAEVAELIVGGGARGRPGGVRVRVIRIGGGDRRESLDEVGVARGSPLGDVTLALPQRFERRSQRRRICLSFDEGQQVGELRPARRVVHREERVHDQGLIRGRHCYRRRHAPMESPPPTLGRNFESMDPREWRARMADLTSRTPGDIAPFFMLRTHLC